MTAVAPPLTLQPSTPHGWASNGGNGGFAAMNSDDGGRMFGAGPRKPLQRQNSASSISSNSSTGSTSTTVAASFPQPNGALPAGADTNSWATRKKPSRAFWPPGKAEPATGLSTARPQAVNSASSGASASSTISALHAPLLPQTSMATGSGKVNGVQGAGQSEPPAILHLLPMNGTFERKTITIPYHPDVLRVGRQTNQKTIPTPLNGYFDSKVLSRQHAEVYADRNGRIFIRDVKSSNGTFVNGMRLSQENKESEPRELREQDVLELGIDIVSEDQKTVVHHKVAAKVEHAGVYGQGNDAISLSELDLDPGSNASSLSGGPLPLKRSGSQGSTGSRGSNGTGVGQLGPGMAALNQPQHLRNWLNPITTEQIVKKLNFEMRLAVQQSEDLARARQTIDAMLSGKFEHLSRDVQAGSDRFWNSPVKSKTDLKGHFSDPPAPPPSMPLPEKPDVAKALADPLIQPLLRRNDTVQPPSATNSPTRFDHTSDILRLCEELKIAKGELSHQGERMRSLEHELAQERTARESAEERAQRFESGGRAGLLDENADGELLDRKADGEDSLLTSAPDLQAQLDRLHASMAEMKQQMELFRQRAESAEAERDEVRQTLAEMIEQKRRDNEAAKAAPRSPPRHVRASEKAPRSPTLGDATNDHAPGPNGHIIAPPMPTSPTSDDLLETAGVEEGQPITPEQAKILTQFLTREILGSRHGLEEEARGYYGIPITSAAAVILLGVVLMNWGNGWPKIDR